MKEITKVVGEIGVDDLWDEAIRKTTAMIVKGALVEEILVSYYPTANNRQLFALTDDPIGITEKIEKDIAGGKTQEDAQEKGKAIETRLFSLTLQEEKPIQPIEK